MRNLKRALSLTLASVMLLGMMVVGTSALSFKDSDQITNVTAAAVMQGIGVFEGDQNGNFLPNVTVTRAQMAAIVGKILYGSKLDAKQFVGTSKFTDVPGNHYANGYINLVASLGLMNGTSATTFTPDRTLTTAEAALLLCRALGYFQGNELTGNWAEDRLTAVSTATKLGLFKDLNLAIDAPLNRDNVAAMTFNTITEAVPVMYNTNFDIYYTDSTSWVSGVNYRWTDTLGYKNFSLVYQIDKDESNRPTTVWGTGKISAGALDSEGRIPAGYKGIVGDDVIIEVANDTAYVYTGKVTYKGLYNDLGKTLVEDYKWAVSVNGVDQNVGAYSNGKGYGDLVANKTKDDKMFDTATGVLTEVYVDSTNKKIDMTVTDTYVAEVTKVKADGDQYEITIRYKGTVPSGLEKTVKVDSTDLKADDIVLITVHGNEIETIELAEIVEGKITAKKGTDYIKLDGTQHNVAKKFYNIGASGTGMPDLNANVKVYLDKYDNMIAVDAQGITVDDYVYITDDAKGLGGLSAEAVFSDGTKKEIKVVDVNGTKTASLVDGAAKGKVFTFTEDDGEYTLTDPAQKLGASSGTSGEIKKGSATVTLSDGSAKATANNKTVFVDVDGGKVYEGYSNVPSYTSATIIGAAKKSGDPAVILFITKGDVSESESFWFYVKSADAEEEKDGSTTYKTYTVYTKDGEDKNFVTKNLTSTGDKAPLVKDTIYKAKSMDADGRLTAFDDAKDVTVTAALNKDATGNVDSKGSGVLALASGSASSYDLSGSNKDTFTYNNDTVFMVVKGKADNASWTTDSVDIGSDGDIGTKTNTTQSKSTVYILNVKDKNDDTPLATLVLVVNAADAPSAPAGGTYTTNVPATLAGKSADVAGAGNYSATIAKASGLAGEEVVTVTVKCETVPTAGTDKVTVTGTGITNETEVTFTTTDTTSTTHDVTFKMPASANVADLALKVSHVTPGTKAKLAATVAYKESDGSTVINAADIANDDTVAFSGTGLSMTFTKGASGWTTTSTAPTGYTVTFDGTNLAIEQVSASKVDNNPFSTVSATPSIAAKTGATATVSPTWTAGTADTTADVTYS